MSDKDQPMTSCRKRSSTSNPGDPPSPTTSEPTPKKPASITSKSTKPTQGIDTFQTIINTIMWLKTSIDAEESKKKLSKDTAKDFHVNIDRLETLCRVQERKFADYHAVKSQLTVKEVNMHIQARELLVKNIVAEFSNSLCEKQTQIEHLRKQIEDNSQDIEIQNLKEQIELLNKEKEYETELDREKMPIDGEVKSRRSRNRSKNKNKSKDRSKSRARKISEIDRYGRGWHEGLR